MEKYHIYRACPVWPKPGKPTGFGDTLLQCGLSYCMQIFVKITRNERRKNKCIINVMKDSYSK